MEERRKSVPSFLLVPGNPEKIFPLTLLIRMEIPRDTGLVEDFRGGDNSTSPRIQSCILKTPPSCV